MVAVLAVGIDGGDAVYDIREVAFGDEAFTEGGFLSSGASKDRFDKYRAFHAFWDIDHIRSDFSQHGCRLAARPDPEAS